MQLSTAQKATFAAWLTANAPPDHDAAAALANTLVAPSYFGWRPSADKQVVDEQIVKASYTPTDAPPPSPSTDMTYQNRALLCQLKQTNAQWLTAGANPINARLPSVRTNFKDCLTNIPSGTAGADKDAGWGTAAVPGAVRLVLMRPLTNFEKLFVTISTGAGNAGGDARGLNTNPDLLGIGPDGEPIEGVVTSQMVSDIRGGL